ncbi:hypothetical protein GCM10010279_22230 [Streptomyces mutabilis]|nr:hypothetical protein GCM10010279_22230 [Streptomyces mutabilis]
MYLFLLAAIVLGVVAKLAHSSGTGYDYRHTIAPWSRGLFTLRRKTELMVGCRCCTRCTRWWGCC